MIEEVQNWIEKITETKFNKDLDFITNLKNGCILCELISKIKGKYIIYNRNPRNSKIMERENIETFLKEVDNIGVNKPNWDYNDLLNKTKKEKEIIKTIFEISNKNKNKDIIKLKGI
jgi:hypothetical protein